MKTSRIMAAALLMVALAGIRGYPPPFLNTARKLQQQQKEGKK